MTNTSLLQESVTYGQKSFIRLGPDWQVNLRNNRGGHHKKLHFRPHAQMLDLAVEVCEEQTRKYL
jgi:hypothetical protein